MHSDASHFYRASGLAIQADSPIVGLRPVTAMRTPDLHISMRGSTGIPQVRESDAIWYASPYRDERDTPVFTVRAIDGSYLLSYSEGTRFLVDASGSRVDAWWETPLTDADAADYLLGSVIAFVLRLRGRVPLHASGVVIDGRAVLFAGAAGAGKSSTAAAFAILGVPVLSDDIVAVAEQGERLLAFASRPRLSVWGDSARSLFAGQSLPTHSDVYLKHRVDLDDRGCQFHESPVPIQTVFILAGRATSGESIAIRPLSPQASLMNLVAHTYGNHLLDASMRAREFDVLGRMAARVEVREISMRDGLDDLVSSCRVLARELALQ